MSAAEPTSQKKRTLIVHKENISSIIFIFYLVFKSETYNWDIGTRKKVFFFWGGEVHFLVLPYG